MKIIKEYINEKFTQDSDPISDMGIGMKEVIKRWIENETNYKTNYDKEDFLWV